MKSPIIANQKEKLSTFSLRVDTEDREKNEEGKSSHLSMSKEQSSFKIPRKRDSSSKIVHKKVNIMHNKSPSLNDD